MARVETPLPQHADDKFTDAELQAMVGREVDLDGQAVPIVAVHRPKGRPLAVVTLTLEVPD